MSPSTPATKPCSISIDRLRAGYGGHTVLHDLNLRLEAGRSVGIAGPNGAGKTTLFKVLLGLLPPTAGTVTVMGRPLATEKDRIWARRQAGYVPQKSQPGRLPVSVGDAVLMGRWGLSFGFFKKPSAEDWRVVRQTLDEVGLAHKESCDCRFLSGGEQQKVAIARALVRNTPILLLDEPTSYLDRQSKAELIAILERIALRRQLTLVTISHDAVHLSEIAEEIFYMEDGEFKERP
jgi:ABC-type cobalamin/Fe3+-siderophores transport system ATPase subunit